MARLDRQAKEGAWKEHSATLRAGTTGPASLSIYRACHQAPRPEKYIFRHLRRQILVLFFLGHHHFLNLPIPTTVFLSIKHLYLTYLGIPYLTHHVLL